MLVILAAAVALRVPMLSDAASWFNSDEAVNALVMKHMVERGELALHAWDASYYGLVEAGLELPFVAVLGWTPLAVKLGALTGFLFLLVATYLLGARLHGTGAGLVAAALLAAFSPMVVLWSTLASGGFTLAVGWGTLTLFVFDRLRGAPRPLPAWKPFLFGALVGFGLYIYELYVVWVALLALWAARAAAPRVARRQIAVAALFLAGLAAGWAPKLAAAATGSIGSKRPFYDLAEPWRMLVNLRLLVSQCAPALLGANPLARSQLDPWMGRPPLPALAVFFALGLAAAWAWTLVRRAPRLRDRELDTESLLVLLVPLTAAAFIVSPNARDVLANRYLLPWLSALPIFAAHALVRVARRSAPAAAVVGVLAVAIPAAAIVTAPHRGRTSLPEVIDYLESQGIRGGRGSYWTAYTATFLSGERIVVTPYLQWDRHPQYTAFVDGLPASATIFEDVVDAPLQAHFVEGLRKDDPPYRVAHIGNYVVYTPNRL